MPIVISDLDYPSLGPRVPKPKPKPKPKYKNKKISDVVCVLCENMRPGSDLGPDFAH